MKALSVEVTQYIEEHDGNRRLRRFPLPVAPTRANVDGRPPPVAAITRRNRVHDPARDRLDFHPR